MLGFSRKFSLSILKTQTTSENNESVIGAFWNKFIRNGLNVFFLFILTILIIIAIAGYLITPDPTPFANRQVLELAMQKPGFSVQCIRICNNTQQIEKHSLLMKMLFGQKDLCTIIPIYTWKISDDSLVVEYYTGMQPNNGQMACYSLSDILQNEGYKSVQMLADGQYQVLTQEGRNLIKSLKELEDIIQTKVIENKHFILGTDRFGRDVLSQLIIGARVSLSVGFISVLISLLIGVTIGAMAGYFGGAADRFFMWLINVVWAIPTLFLVIAITFALGKGFWQIFIAVGLTLWVEIARLVRGLVMSVKNREFVEAARALGYSHFRIIVYHILPSIMGPVIVVSAANFASAILIESGLSFLGIGIQPPMPSWGSMLRENYGFLIMEYAYLALLPGFAIMLLVLTFMVLGNGMRDALDVKQTKI